MTRVSIPDDYEGRDVPIPGTEPDDAGSIVGGAGPNTAQVREDDQGRYAGIPEQHADAVREWLAENVDGYDPGGESDDGPETADAVPPQRAPDEHWRVVVKNVEAGAYDGRLDALADADDRKSVQNAIQERRSD